MEDELKSRTNGNYIGYKQTVTILARCYTNLSIDIDAKELYYQIEFYRHNNKPSVTSLTWRRRRVVKLLTMFYTLWYHIRFTINHRLN